MIKAQIKKYSFVIICSLIFALSPNQSFSQVWTDKSPHKEGFVNANSIKLHYLDWGGQGETLVFLTGMGVTAHIFDDLAPKFNDRFGVVSYTRRGLYKSDKPTGGYDTATLTEDLRGFLDALKIQRATLIGWSLAGTEMTRFAALYPERVNRLVYLDSAYDYSSLLDIWSKDPIAVNPTKEDLASWEASENWFKKTYGVWSDAIEADGRAANLQSDGTVKLEAMPPEITGQLIKGMTEAKPDFSKIKAPALAFFAVNDSHPFISLAKSEGERERANEYWREVFSADQRRQIARLKKAKPSARVVELEDSQHLCFFRERDKARIIKEMDSFLAKK